MPGGYLGWAGFGGRGGGLSVFCDTLTVDGDTISDNDAGGPGAGSSPLPASGGGILTLSGHVTLTNGAVVSGNRPNNCSYPEEVPGCVNDQPTVAVTVMARQADDLAIAEKTAAKAKSVK